AGLEIANTNYGDFKETGGGIYDLDTKGGNYLRSAGRVGAGVDYEKGIWIWYANVEGKCVFEGTKPEIESQFNGTGIEFNSRGADEKNVVIGAGAGGEVRISQHWKGFANAKYYIGEKYENIYGNIGVRYLFGKGKSKADEEANRLADEKAKLQAAREAAAQQAKLEAQRQAEAAAAAEEARKQALAREEAAKAQRIAEEAAITKEISDADLAKQKAEAEARRKRPMLKTYTLTTHFATNSYDLNEEDKKQIDAIAEELKGLDFKKIAIEGHTDNTGSKETNKRLSRQRARSVYDEFIKAGIPAEKLSYQGFADTMPVQSNATAAGRAANRRTEIFVE
ncbi:MAG: OmpA family protein, partial [Endomicrobia bacterium]|nr:OmpA family protein [Endomicrobiia bacterium]